MKCTFDEKSRCKLNLFFGEKFPSGSRQGHKKGDDQICVRPANCDRFLEKVEGAVDANGEEIQPGKIMAGLNSRGC